MVILVLHGTIVLLLVQQSTECALLSSACGLVKRVPSYDQHATPPNMIHMRRVSLMLFRSYYT